MKARIWVPVALVSIACLGLIYASLVGADSESMPKDPIRVSKGYGTVLFPSPKGGEDKVPPVAFSHRSHRSFGIKNCRDCHNDEVFAKSQEIGANKITMEAIYAGKFCGACHNGEKESPVTGKTVFAAEKDSESSCKRCHNVVMRKSS